jgi:hypothetical protein
MSKDVYPKRFVLYFDWDDEILCGSDAYMPVDGRFSIDNAIKHIRNHRHTIDLVNRTINIAGFRICTGTILNPVYLTNLIYLTDVDPRYKSK